MTEETILKFIQIIGIIIVMLFMWAVLFVVIHFIVKFW